MRILRILAVIVISAGLLTCESDSVIVDVSGRADTLVIAGRTGSEVVVGADTTVSSPDTVFRTRVDTLLAPADTVLITTVDTVVTGTDTTYVTVVDTVVTVNTVVVTTVDTLVQVDTVIVERTVELPSQLSSSSSTLNLLVGETATLTVTAQDPLGTGSVPSGVSWVSDASGIASVNSTGRVRGESPGLANIFAVAAGLYTSIPTTVRLASVPEGGFFEGFDAGSFGSRGWYDNTVLTLSTTERHSGAGALRIDFEAGSQLPTFGAGARHLITEAETVYVSFWIKHSTNWVGSGHLFLLLTNGDGDYVGPAFTRLTTYIESTYNGGVIPALAMSDRVNIDQARVGQDLTNVSEDRAAAGCNGQTDGYQTSCFQINGTWWNDKYWFANEVWFTNAAGARYKGDWHFVEAYFQLNSIQNGRGVPDGVARYWYDGNLIMNLEGVLFRTGSHPDMRFRQFMIGPYLGVPSAVDQTIWIDELTVASNR